MGSRQAGFDLSGFCDGRTSASAASAQGVRIGNLEPYKSENLVQIEKILIKVGPRV